MTELNQLLDRLDSNEHEEAWAEFLSSYAPQILQVVHHFHRDPDRRGDCFVFVCEELQRDRCRRLRRYEADRGASFTTWLQLLTRNLCLDWWRKLAGRFRPFRSLAASSAVEEEIYRCVYERGLSVHETLLTLRSAYPDLVADQVAEAVERLESRLSSRQRWLLGSRRPVVVPLAGNPGHEDSPYERQVPAPDPDPEVLAGREESRAKLAHALVRLEPGDRLLVRLRYEQGLTLEKVASLAGLRNAQQADRRLREVLEELKREME